jgi:peptidoglycan biosynthesis protein MviN/MurJ (putative lipid II flippase)
MRSAENMPFISVIIGLFIAMLILGIVWYAIQRLLPLIPLAEPFATIVHVLLVVIIALIVVYFLIALLGAAGISVPMFGRF